MTCGKGITHIEENASLHSEATYVQLWLAPNFGDIQPKYQKKDFNSSLSRNKLVTIASPYLIVDKVPVKNVTAEDLKRQEMPGAEMESPSLCKENSAPNESTASLEDELLNITKKVNSTLGLYSDTYVYQCVLEPGCKVKVPIIEGKKRKAYIHVPGPESRGLIAVNYEDHLKPGDGAFIGSLNGVKSIDMKNIGKDTCQFIFLDMA
ncbi:hypothetical protein DSO57_1027698 [Entomophthora muscae]|uniref:Uncharacterized protein n=1 Tax=Entomophthora muscae TaxID=34485 RepID=A0ACC2TNQ6_9FUNG|nr:hypothetical protein DSO57_1027698 [Entomophthora muscae]